MLFLLFTSLPATLCAKNSSSKTSGDSKPTARQHKAFQGRRTCVQKCLTSSQYEQQRLAPEEGHRCLFEHAIVQYRHTVQAPAAAIGKTPAPSAFVKPKETREHK